MVEKRKVGNLFSPPLREFENEVILYGRGRGGLEI